MAAEEREEKRRKLKAKTYRDRLRTEGGGNNMAGVTSTGSGATGETGQSNSATGGTSSEKPTTTPSRHGLLGAIFPDSERRGKRAATSPVETWDKLTKAFKSAFSPKNKTPEHSNVYIDDAGLTHVLKPGERIPLRSLALQVNSPLPKFDPDYEIVQLP